MKKAIQYQINTKNPKFAGKWLTAMVVDAAQAKFAYDKVVKQRPAGAWNFRMVNANEASNETRKPEKAKVETEKPEYKTINGKTYRVAYSADKEARKAKEKV